MSDLYGICTALRGVAHVYFQLARRTGRTTAMVQALNSGDRAIFVNQREADRVRRLCREAGKDVQCLTVPVNQPERLFNMPPPQGKTVFDHSWIQERLLTTLELESDWIRNIQGQLSNDRN